MSMLIVHVHIGNVVFNLVDDDIILKISFYICVCDLFVRGGYVLLQPLISFTKEVWFHVYFKYIITFIDVMAYHVQLFHFNIYIIMDIVHNQPSFDVAINNTINPSQGIIMVLGLDITVIMAIALIRITIGMIVSIKSHPCVHVWYMVKLGFRFGLEF